MIAVAAAAVGVDRQMATNEATTVSVPVATRTIGWGEVVGEADIDRRSVPAALVPPGVATDPVGRLAASTIQAGEVVLAARLGGEGRAGLGPDEVAVALPPGGAPLPLVPGDVVELIGVGVDPAGGVATRQLGRGRVVTVDEASVTVAVAAGAAAPVVSQLAMGSISLALTPYHS